MQQQTQLTTAAAAEWLAERAPARSTAEWTRWLTNNANPKRRAPFRVPRSKIGGRYFYEVSDLGNLVDYDQAIREGWAPSAANTLAIAESSLTNQRWSSQGRFYGQYDDTAQEPFVKLAIDQPLQTFRLSLEDAARLFTQLEGAIINAESIASERNPEYQRKLKPRT